jgi:hypothetical protein
VRNNAYLGAWYGYECVRDILESPKLPEIRFTTMKVRTEGPMLLFLFSLKLSDGFRNFASTKKTSICDPIFTPLGSLYKRLKAVALSKCIALHILLWFPAVRMYCKSTGRKIVWSWKWMIGASERDYPAHSVRQTKKRFHRLGLKQKRQRKTFTEKSTDSPFIWHFFSSFWHERFPLRSFHGKRIV